MRLILFALVTLFAGNSIAQQTTPVLFVSEKLCIIYVDGIQKGTADNNNPLLVKLSFGEHYFQAKRDEQTFTKVIKCENASQKVVEINFDNETKSNQQTTATPTSNTTAAALPVSATVISAATATVVMDNTIKLPGLLKQREMEPVQFYFAFDKGDTILLRNGQTGETGTNNFYVFNYPSNQQLYFREALKANVEEKFIVPSKGVYVIRVTTNYFADKNSRLKVVRFASSNSSSTFNTAPIIKSDTSFVQLNDIYERIETTGFYRSINLPQNTKFWVYWIGIGEESKIKYETFRELFARDARGNNSNPIYAFGTSQINQLPSYNHPSKTLDYYFSDNANTQLFLKNLAYKSYSFKYGKYITTDYSLVTSVPKELNLIVNAEKMKGQFVNMKIGAFVVNSFYTISE